MSPSISAAHTPTTPSVIFLYCSYCWYHFIDCMLCTCCWMLYLLDKEEKTRHTVSGYNRHPQTVHYKSIFSAISKAKDFQGITLQQK